MTDKRTKKVADVRVVADGKKFSVMVDYITRGCAYKDKASADAMAQKIKDQGIW